ncbi:MAG: cation transporter [Candidatus Moraniibacteriota bacterium]
MTHDKGCYRCKAEVYAYAITLYIIVACLEFWGSGQTASLSLASDAWHMVFDTLGYCIGLIGALSVFRFYHSEQRIERNKRRLEILMGLFLIGTSLAIFYQVGGRLWRGDVPEIIEGWLLLSIAAIGLLVNAVFLALFWALKIEHTHGDGEPHAHASKDKILSANIWHTVSDIASSMMVVGNGITYQMTSDSSWFFLEFPVAIVIASLLLWQGWRILSPERDVIT